MRIIRFADEHGTRWGFEGADSIHPAGSGVALESVLRDPEALSAARAGAGSPIPLASVQVLAPIAAPSQFIGVGLNYRDHAAEAGMEIPSSPITFGFLASSVIGEGDAIVIPPFTDQVDWEAELGIVIGSGGKNIEAGQALEHVAGYTIVNDVSARDIQVADGQWGRAKSFDTFKPMGPVVATTDELGDASSLAISLSVNGVVKQSSKTSELIFSVPELVSRLSRSTTLLPGAVISTGTPAGVGFSRTPPEFLRPGDTVTIEIEGIGRLTNPVAAAEGTA